MNPVYCKLFFVNFGYKLLDNSCFKITKNNFYFHVNEDNFEIIPLNIISRLIDEGKTLNVKIILYNKIGEIISVIYLEDTIVLKIKGLLNLDWESDNIIKIRVKYKYNKMKIFNGGNIREFRNYERKQKLKILSQI